VGVFARLIVSLNLGLFQTCKWHIQS